MFLPRRSSAPMPSKSVTPTAPAASPGGLGSAAIGMPQMPPAPTMPAASNGTPGIPNPNANPRALQAMQAQQLRGIGRFTPQGRFPQTPVMPPPSPVMPGPVPSQIGRYQLPTDPWTPPSTLPPPAPYVK